MDLQGVLGWSQGGPWHHYLAIQTLNWLSKCFNGRNRRGFCDPPCNSIPLRPHVNRVKYCIPSRFSCGIKLDNVVVMTGGSDSAGQYRDTITSYSLEGSWTTLPSLQTPRNLHGCAHYRNYNDEIVSWNSKYWNSRFLIFLNRSLLWQVDSMEIIWVPQNCSIYQEAYGSIQNFYHLPGEVWLEFQSVTRFSWQVQIHVN